MNISIGNFGGSNNASVSALISQLVSKRTQSLNTLLDQKTSIENTLAALQGGSLGAGSINSSYSSQIASLQDTIDRMNEQYSVNANKITTINSLKKSYSATVSSLDKYIESLKNPNTAGKDPDIYLNGDKVSSNDKVNVSVNDKNTNINEITVNVTQVATTSILKSNLLAGGTVTKNTKVTDLFAGLYDAAKNSIKTNRQDIKESLKMSDLGVTSGSFNLGSATITIDADTDTVGSVLQKIRDAGYNAEIETTSYDSNGEAVGRLVISGSPDQSIAITSQTTNFTSLMGITVSEGNFYINGASFNIDSNTTIGSLMADINAASADNVGAKLEDGKLVFVASETGAVDINVTKGTSNFTNAIGFTVGGVMNNSNLVIGSEGSYVTLTGKNDSVANTDSVASGQFTAGSFNISFNKIDEFGNVSEEMQTVTIEVTESDTVEAIIEKIKNQTKGSYIDKDGNTIQTGLTAEIVDGHFRIRQTQKGAEYNISVEAGSSTFTNYVGMTSAVSNATSKDAEKSYILGTTVVPESGFSEGSFTISTNKLSEDGKTALFETISATIHVSADDTALSIAQKINDAGLGLTATITPDGHFKIEQNNAGADFDISIQAGGTDFTEKAGLTTNIINTGILSPGSSVNQFTTLTGSADVTGETAIKGGSFKINGVNITFNDGTINDAINTINSYSEQTGVNAYLKDGKVVLQANKTGADYTIYVEGGTSDFGTVAGFLTKAESAASAAVGQSGSKTTLTGAYSVTADSAVTAGTININGYNVDIEAGTLADAIKKINEHSANTGVTAAISNGKLVLTNVNEGSTSINVVAGSSNIAQVTGIAAFQSQAGKEEIIGASKTTMTASKTGLTKNDVIGESVIYINGEKITVGGTLRSAINSINANSGFTGVEAYLDEQGRFVLANVNVGAKGINFSCESGDFARVIGAASYSTSGGSSSQVEKTPAYITGGMSGLDVTTEIIGGGTLTINGTDISLDGISSLGNLVKKINSLNLGVIASINDDGNFVITANDSSTSLNVNFSGDGNFGFVTGLGSYSIGSAPGTSGGTGSANNGEIIGGNDVQTGGGSNVENVSRMSEAEARAAGYTIIRTAQDLQNMSANLSGKYMLMNDIDMTGVDWNTIGNTEANAFTGTLDGNGYVINNYSKTVANADGQVNVDNWASIFGYTTGATIKNLGIENANVINGMGVLISAAQDTTIDNVYATGVMNANEGWWVGGLIGVARNLTISNSYSKVDVTGGNIVGGLVGIVAGNTSITNSFIDAAITGDNIGGLIGGSFGDPNVQSVVNISNSYVTGQLIYRKSTSSSTSIAASVGGLVGGASYSNYTVTNSFVDSTFVNIPSTGDHGGLIADTAGAVFNVTNSYYNNEKNDFTNAQNLEGTGISSSEMNAKLSQQVASWNTDIWDISGDSPKLKIFEAHDIYTPPAVLSEAEAIAQGYTVIKTAQDLQNMANNLAGKYILMGDIDLSSISNWTSIGNTDLGFTGIFNGNGYTISNLTINNTDPTAGMGVGLFGVTNGAYLVNVKIENANVTGFDGVGILVGGAQDTIIKNVHTSGIVTSASTAHNEANAAGTGGVAGALITSNIMNSSSSATVSGDIGVGGLVGAVGMMSTVRNSYANGSVSGYDMVGGLAGVVVYQSNVTNSYSTGAVSATGALDHVGGLVGTLVAYSTVSNSYWNAEKSGQSAGYGTNDNVDVTPGITNLTTAQFAQEASFDGWNNTLWDFSGSVPTIRQMSSSSGPATQVGAGSVILNGKTVNITGGSIDSVIDQINAQSSQTGVVASIENNKVVLRNTDGSNTNIAVKAGTSDFLDVAGIDEQGIGIGSYTTLTGGRDVSDAVFNEGKITINKNGTNIVVDIAAGSTAQDVADAINAKKAGIAASIVEKNGKQFLQITSTTKGADSISISVNKGNFGEITGFSATAVAGPTIQQPGTKYTTTVKSNYYIYDYNGAKTFASGGITINGAFFDAEGKTLAQIIEEINKSDLGVKASLVEGTDEDGDAYKMFQLSKSADTSAASKISVSSSGDFARVAGFGTYTTGAGTTTKVPGTGSGGNQPSVSTPTTLTGNRTVTGDTVVGETTIRFGTTGQYKIETDASATINSIINSINSSTQDTGIKAALVDGKFTLTRVDAATANTAIDITADIQFSSTGTFGLLTGLSDFTSAGPSSTPGQTTSKTLGELAPSELIYSVNQLTEEQALAQGYTLIKTKEDFVSKLQADPNGKFILMNSISLDGVSDKCIIDSFNGELNGNGYSVGINISLYSSSQPSGIALFNNLGASASIHDLMLVSNFSISFDEVNDNIEYLAPLAVNSSADIFNVGSIVAISSANFAQSPAGNVNIKYISGLVGKQTGGSLSAINTNLIGAGVALNNFTYNYVSGIAGTTTSGAIIKDSRTSIDFNFSNATWRQSATSVPGFIGSMSSDCTFSASNNYVSKYSINGSSPAVYGTGSYKPQDISGTITGSTMNTEILNNLISSGFFNGDIEVYNNGTSIAHVTVGPTSTISSIVSQINSSSNFTAEIDSTGRIVISGKDGFDMSNITFGGSSKLAIATGLQAGIITADSTKVMGTAGTSGGSGVKTPTTLTGNRTVTGNTLVGATTIHLGTSGQFKVELSNSDTSVYDVLAAINAKTNETGIKAELVEGKFTLTRVENASVAITSDIQITSTGNFGLLTGLNDYTSSGSTAAASSQNVTKTQTSKSLSSVTSNSLLFDVNRLTEEQAIAQGYTVIKTADEFVSLLSANKNGKFILMNDISISLGNINSVDSFNGELNGNGYKITKSIAYKDAQSNANAGLFGTLGSSSYVHDLIVVTACLVNSEASGSISALGSLAGISYGNISNVSGSLNIGYLKNSSSHSSISSAGGLVGEQIGGSIFAANGYAQVRQVNVSSLANTELDVIGGIAGDIYNGATLTGSVGGIGIAANYLNIGSASQLYYNSSISSSNYASESTVISLNTSKSLAASGNGDYTATREYTELVTTVTNTGSNSSVTSLNSLISSGFISGTFTMSVQGSEIASIDISSSDTIDTILQKIKDANPELEASIVDGKLVISIANAEGLSADAVTFGGTSNFAVVAGLKSGTITADSTKVMGTAGTSGGSGVKTPTTLTGNRTVTGDTVIGSYDIMFGVTGREHTVTSASSTSTINDVINAFNAISATTGIQASLQNGKFTLTRVAVDGTDITSDINIDLQNESVSVFSLVTGIGDCESFGPTVEYNNSMTVTSDKTLSEASSSDSLIFEVNRLTEEQATALGYTTIHNSTEFINALKADPTGKFVLMNDISINGSYDIAIDEFNGELNGNGYTLSGEAVYSFYDSTTTASIFGTLGEQSYVHDLKLNVIYYIDNPATGSNVGIAPLAAVSKGNIFNVQSTLTINNSNRSGTANLGYIAGLVGTQESGTIDSVNTKIVLTEPYNYGSSTGKANVDYLSGIAGQIKSAATIKNSVSDISGSKVGYNLRSINPYGSGASSATVMEDTMQSVCFETAKTNHTYRPTTTITGDSINVTNHYGSLVDYTPLDGLVESGFFNDGTFTVTRNGETILSVNMADIYDMSEMNNYTMGDVATTMDHIIEALNEEAAKQGAYITFYDGNGNGGLGGIAVDDYYGTELTFGGTSKLAVATGLATGKISGDSTKVLGTAGTSNALPESYHEITALTEAEAIAQGYTVIKTAQDLQNINNDLAGKYILMGDIDLSTINTNNAYAGEFAFLGAFTGTLDGNGFTIKNGNLRGETGSALFTELNGATVKNLAFDNMTSTSQVRSAAILAMWTDGAVIDNIKITNSKVIGNETGNLLKYSAGTGKHAAGSLIGLSTGTAISHVYLENVNVENRVSGAGTSFRYHTSAGTLVGLVKDPASNTRYPMFTQINNIVTVNTTARSTYGSKAGYNNDDALIGYSTNNLYVDPDTDPSYAKYSCSTINNIYSDNAIFGRLAANGRCIFGENVTYTGSSAIREASMNFEGTPVKGPDLTEKLQGATDVTNSMLTSGYYSQTNSPRETITIAYNKDGVSTSFDVVINSGESLNTVMDKINAAGGDVTIAVEDGKLVLTGKDGSVSNINVDSTGDFAAFYGLRSTETDWKWSEADGGMSTTITTEQTGGAIIGSVGGLDGTTGGFTEGSFTVSIGSGSTKPTTTPTVTQVGHMTEESAIASGYTIIKTAQDLQNIQNNLAGKYMLMADIDLSSLGTLNDCLISDVFTGIFDGNGYTISNLKIDAGNATQTAMFNQADGATIKNLKIKSANIAGGDYTAALIANAKNTTVENVDIEAHISSSYSNGSGNIAGIAAIFDGGTISNSHVGGSITHNTASSSAFGIGGLVGYTSDSVIRNSYADTILSAEYAGGLIYSGSNVEIYDSYFGGNYTSSSGSAGAIAYEISGNYVVSNTHWNATNADISDGIYNDDAQVNGGQLINVSGLTSTQMADASNFTGWDTTVWDFSGAQPVLKTQSVNAGDGTDTSVPREVTINITADDTIDTILQKLQDQGIDAVLENGHVVIKGTTDATFGGTSDFAQKVGLIGGTIGSDFTEVIGSGGTGGGYKYTGAKVSGMIGGSTLAGVTDGKIVVTEKAQDGTIISHDINVSSTDTVNDVLTKIMNEFGDKVTNAYVKDNRVIIESKFQLGFDEDNSTSNFLKLSGLSATGFTSDSNSTLTEASDGFVRITGSVDGLDINSNLGGLIAGNLVLSQGSFTQSIEIASTDTIRDIINKINATGDFAAGLDENGSFYIQSKHEGKDAITIDASNIMNLDEILGLNSGTFVGEMTVHMGSAGRVQVTGGNKFEGTSGTNSLVGTNNINEPNHLTEAQAIAQGYTVIKTAADLQNINNNLSGKFMLMNDIDLSSLGTLSSALVNGDFTGIFNGNGYTISNLKVSTGDSSRAGLFATTHDATIENLIIKDAQITAYSDAGILVGNASNTTISNIYVTGSVDGEKSVGGLVGSTSGTTIKGSGANVTVRASEMDSYVGGLVGNAYTTNIQNSYSEGTLTNTGSENAVGGLAGMVSGRDSNVWACYSAMNVTSSGTMCSVGAFVGAVDASKISIQSCVAKTGLNALGNAETNSNSLEVDQVDNIYNEASLKPDWDEETWNFSDSSSNPKLQYFTSKQVSAGTLVINDTTITLSGGNIESAIDDINAKSAETGVVASISDGKVVFNGTINSIEEGSSDFVSLTGTAYAPTSDTGSANSALDTVITPQFTGADKTFIISSSTGEKVTINVTDGMTLGQLIDQINASGDYTAELNSEGYFVLTAAKDGMTDVTFGGTSGLETFLGISGGTINVNPEENIGSGGTHSTLTGNAQVNNDMTFSSGNFIISAGDKSVEFIVNEGETITSVMNKINNSEVGVTASIQNGKLVLTAKESGAIDISLTDGTSNFAELTGFVSSGGDQLSSVVKGVLSTYTSGNTAQSAQNSGISAGDFYVHLTDQAGNITETAKITIGRNESIASIIDKINNSGLGVTASINDSGKMVITRNSSDTAGGVLVTKGSSDFTNKIGFTSGGYQSPNTEYGSQSILTSTNSVSTSKRFSNGNFIISIEDNGTVRDTAINVLDTDSIYDIIDKINAAGAGVTASLNANNKLVLIKDADTGAGGITVKKGSSDFTTTMGFTSGGIYNGTLTDGEAATHTVLKSNKLAVSGIATMASLGIRAGIFKINGVEIAIKETDTIDDVVGRINTIFNSDIYKDIAVTAEYKNNQIVLTTKNASSNARITVESGSTNFTEVVGFTDTASRNNVVDMGQNAKFNVKIGSDPVGKDYDVALDLKDITNDNIYNGNNLIYLDANGKVVAHANNAAITIEVKDTGETVIKIGQNLLDASLNELNKFVGNFNKAMISSENEILSDDAAFAKIINNIKTALTNDVADMRKIQQQLADIGITIDIRGGTNSNMGTVRIYLDREKYTQAFYADSQHVMDLLIGKETAVGVEDGVLTRLNNVLYPEVNNKNGYFNQTPRLLEAVQKQLRREITSTTFDLNELKNAVSGTAATDGLSEYLAQLEEQYKFINEAIANLNKQYSTSVTRLILNQNNSGFNPLV